MALDLGELVGTIELDDRGFSRPMQQAERGINRLESTTHRSLNRMEQDFGEAGRGAARELSRGLDRAATEAGQAGQQAGEQFTRGADGKLRDAKSRFVAAGRDAGKGFGKAAERGIRGTDLGGAGRDAGEDAADGLGDGVERRGRGRMRGVGGKLAGALGKGGPWIAAGAVVGGFFLQGLQGAMEKQDALAKLKAQVGDFGPSSEVLGKAAGALYAKGYGESMGDVTEGIRAVVQNLDGMNNASSRTLQTMGARAMNVATIMDEDVGAVTRAVSQLLRTGLAKNAKEAFDLIVAGTQQGANASGDLLDTITEYSTQFRAVGISGPKAMGLMAQAVRAGARDLDTAADAIKEFAIRSKDGSDSSREAFEDLGFSADKMFQTFAAGGPKADQAFKQVVDRLKQVKDPAKQSELAVALFGTKAEDLQDALFAFDPTTAVQSLGKIGGAADKAGKTLHDTASKNIERFKRQAKSALVDMVGGKVLPALTEFGEKVGPLIQKGVGEIKKWLEENEDKVDEWSTKIGEIVSTIEDIVDGVTDAVSGFWDIFGDDILDGVANAIDTALGVVEGLFEQLLGVWNIFAGIFTGDWDRVWEGVKQIFSGIFKVIGSILKGALKGAWIQIKAVWGKLIPKVVKWAWDKLVQLVKWGAKKVLSIVDWFKALPGKAKQWFGRMKDAAVAKARSLASWMRGLPGRIRRALGHTGRLLWNAGRNVVTGLINGITSKFGALARKASEMASKIRNYLPFSPAKEGPLSGSGSPEIAGAKIGSMLAAGISSSRGDVAAAMNNLSGLAAPAFTARRPGGGSAVRGGDGAQVTVVVDVSGGDRFLKEWIRRTVRVEGRGDVQVAFGQSRATTAARR